MPYDQIHLTSNWTFKQGDRTSSSPYFPAHDAPTEIYRDLLKNHKIADPFLDLNELAVRWVGEETWTYRCIFRTTTFFGQGGIRPSLKLEGLDTIASVYLNGKLISKSDNMFLEHRIDVCPAIVTARENVLEIEFEPARKKGLKLVKDHPEHDFIVHQTEVSRGPVRKAQYHWGWDWGPILMTCGPWKPITLEAYTYRIDDIWVTYELSDDLKTVKGRMFAKVEGERPEAQKVEFSLTKGGYEMCEVEKGRYTSDGVFEADFVLDPSGPLRLWWPRGYGEQTLYEARAFVSQPTTRIPYHSAYKTIGFRKVELVRQKDSTGTSFYFRVNNVDIFVGGSCWIPADSFLSRVTAERYREWIQLAAKGNQNMIRVWGGGVYEVDAFYSACDELGILVWQDFMFACANYPAYPEYLKSVEQEARQNVRRIRNHPCIALWCGNNEDYQIVERYGLQYDVDNIDPEAWLETNFPARYIYEYLLPMVVIEEANGMPYHPSSPFGDGKSTTLKVDPSIGDIHQWNVWHGTMEPYQSFPYLGGRFVSEFGMEAYPHLETLERCITRKEDRYPGSMAMDFRNKAIGHERRLVSYVTENFRMRTDLPSYTHLTQVMQADAMGWAYRSWRRNWGHNGNRKCGGVLVWQLNDCWPTVSWSMVDYYLVPKPAYYAIKREMEPVVIGVMRKTYDWTKRPADELWKRETGHIDLPRCWEDVRYNVWVANSKLETIRPKVVLKFISIKTGREVVDRAICYKDVQPNGTTEILSDTFRSKRDPKQPYDTSTADPFIIYASLQVQSEEVSSCISWPEPIKYLDFSSRDVKVNSSENGDSVVVTTRRPVKGFVFSERQGVRLSDNGFDLVPGIKKTVYVNGIHASKLEWRYVGM